MELSGFEKIFAAFMAGLIAIAIWETLVKPGQQTPQVINAAGTAIGSSLYAAQGVKQ